MKLFYFSTFFLVSAGIQLGQISLPAGDSYIIYEPFSWQVGSGRLVLTLDFETKSQDGKIFGLRAQNETGDLVHHLNVHVSNGRVLISQSQPIQTFPHEILAEVVSDGEIHRLTLSYEHFGEGMKFTHQLDPTGTLFMTFGTDVNFANPGDLLNISMFYGKSGDAKSVVGCLQHNISTGGSSVLLREASSGNGASGKCPTPCTTGQLQCLNGGVCTDILLTNSVCDCYGSDHSGATCEKDSNNVVCLKEKTDFYYSLDEAENVQRIALSFKFDLDYHWENHQPIFSTSIWKYGYMDTYMHLYILRSMHLYYEASHIFLSIDLVTKEFSQFIEKDGKWHNFVLTVDYSNRVMSARLDSQELKIPFQDTLRSKRLFHRKIRFGGVDFVGCLSNVYVDHNQVLEMLNSTDVTFTVYPRPVQSAHSHPAVVSILIFVFASLTSLLNLV